MTAIKQAVTIAIQSPKQVIQVTLGKSNSPLGKAIFHTIERFDIAVNFLPFSVFLKCALRCIISRLNEQLFWEIVQANRSIQILWPRPSLSTPLDSSINRSPTHIHKEVASIVLSLCWWLLFIQACCDPLKLVLCLGSRGSLKWNPSRCQERIQRVEKRRNHRKLILTTVVARIRFICLWRTMPFIRGATRTLWHSKVHVIDAEFAGACMHWLTTWANTWWRQKNTRKLPFPLLHRLKIISKQCNIKGAFVNKTFVDRPSRFIFTNVFSELNCSDSFIRRFSRWVYREVQTN